MVCPIIGANVTSVERAKSMKHSGYRNFNICWRNLRIYAQNPQSPPVCCPTNEALTMAERSSASNLGRGNCNPPDHRCASTVSCFTIVAQSLLNTACNHASDCPLGFKRDRDLSTVVTHPLFECLTHSRVVEVIIRLLELFVRFLSSFYRGVEKP